MLGYLANTGHLVLPADMQVLSDPLVMMAAAVMYCVEFFADKVPWFDTFWDSVHTFIRPVGAAVLAKSIALKGRRYSCVTSATTSISPAVCLSD